MLMHCVNIVMHCGGPGLTLVPVIRQAAVVEQHASLSSGYPKKTTASDQHQNMPDLKAVREIYL